MIAKIGVVLTGALVMALMFSLIVFGNNLMPKERVYDCSLAEFHPDYPVEVKNKCRQIRSQKLTTT